MRSLRRSDSKPSLTSSPRPKAQPLNDNLQFDICGIPQPDFETSPQVISDKSKSPPSQNPSPLKGHNNVTSTYEGEGSATLRDHVDKLECKLALALKTYRQQAEDALEEHYDIVELTQNALEHQVALLKSENVQLRKMVGVKNPDSSTAQNIMFQTMPQEVERDKKAVAKAVRRGDTDDKFLKRGKQKLPGNAQPGGSWQNFMAWVPNGAALTNPEPWKPLPPSFGGKLNMPLTPSSISSASPNSDAMKLHKLQGAAVDDDNDSKDDDDKSESSNSDIAVLEKEHFEAVDAWKPTQKELKKMSGKHSVWSGASEDRTEADSLIESTSIDLDLAAKTPKPWYMFDPDSTVRIAWDCSSLLLIVYDMIMIPMMSFNLPQNPGTQTMDWVIRLFWTFDIGWSCCTGVVLDDGTLLYNAKYIFTKYAKSWLPVDLFIVISDWLGLLFESGGFGFSRLARVSRIERAIRLVRLVRMQEIIASIAERNQSVKVQLCLQVAKLSVFLIMSCHVMACIWWAIGDRDIDEHTWITKYGYHKQDLEVGYLASLHWSLAQFGGGMDEISPANVLERFYAVTVCVFGFVAALVMLSFLTSTMTQEYIIGGSGARQMATLKTYLAQNKVPQNLIKRLCRNAKHAISGDLTADTVDLLHVVSEPLQVEMHYAIYGRILIHHPFFKDLMNISSLLFRRICHLACSSLWLASGDVVFQKGEEPADPKMFFVVSGILQYTDNYGEKTQVMEKTWMAEAALWTTWKHMGTLVAVNDVKVAMLDAIVFQDLVVKFMKKSRRTAVRMKRYARDFINELNACEHCSDLNYLLR